MPRRVVVPSTQSNTPSTPPPKKGRYTHQRQHRNLLELNPKSLAQIVAGIERGLHPHEAAALANISYRSFSRYMQFARLGDPRYQYLEEAVKGAEARFADKCLRQISRAGIEGVGDKDPDWKAVSKLLELRLKDWKPKVEVSTQAETESEARRLLDHVRKVCGEETAEAVITSYLAEGGERVFGGPSSPES